MIEVRTATAQDGAFVAELCNRFAEFDLPPWRSAHEINSGTAWRMAQALDSMDERSTVAIAQDEHGRPLGFAWFHLMDDFYGGPPVTKLSEIAVVRNGTGAGAALMDAVERWARERGCGAIVLNVLQGNAHARDFYRKHGYEAEYTQMVRPLT